MDIGLGEPGMTPTDNDTRLSINSHWGNSSCNKSPKSKLESSINDSDIMMIAIIDLCAKDNEPVNKLAKKLLLYLLN